MTENDIFFFDHSEFSAKIPELLSTPMEEGRFSAISVGRWRRRAIIKKRTKRAGFYFFMTKHTAEQIIRKKKNDRYMPKKHDTLSLSVSIVLKYCIFSTKITKRCDKQT